MNRFFFTVLLISFSTLSFSQRNNDNIGTVEQQPSQITSPNQQDVFSPEAPPSSSLEPVNGTGAESFSTMEDPDPGFPDGGGGSGSNPTQDNNNIPIDGGLSVLLAVGLGKGAKSYLKYRKNKE